VGNVAPRGSGAVAKPEVQPHALTVAPGAALRSEDKARELVPGPGDAESAIPREGAISQAGVPQIEVTTEMIEVGVAVDRSYAALFECDERDSIRDIFVGMILAELANASH
jgi:hypothetical protein